MNGPKPSCLCGTCQVCRQRRAAQAWRNRVRNEVANLEKLAALPDPPRTFAEELIDAGPPESYAVPPKQTPIGRMIDENRDRPDAIEEIQFRDTMRRIDREQS